MNGSCARDALCYRQARRAAITKVALILVEMLILATVVDCIRTFLAGWETMGITEK